MSIKNLMRQFVKFSFAGIIASLTDVALLAMLKEVFEIEVMIASAISFCVAVIVNYILSMTFVFKSKNSNKAGEFITFVLLSVGGLCINQLIMYFGAVYMSFYYLLIKVVAMVIEGIYNFVTRKIFIEGSFGL